MNADARGTNNVLEGTLVNHYGDSSRSSKPAAY
jgi:hypothetical protein